MLLDLLILGAYVVARHGARSAGRLVESGKDVHSGGLAGTVGTEEAENLATADRETDVIDSTEVTESLDEMRHLDDAVALLRRHSVVMRQTRRVENLAEALQYHLGRAYALNPPLMEESHTVTAAHLVQIGCGDHDGDATLPEQGEHLPKLLAADRVHTRGGFVEKEHAGLVYQGTRECQFLLHAARERPCLAVLEALYLTVDGLDAVVTLGHGRPEECRKKLQVLLDRKVLIQREAAGHVSHLSAYLLHLPYHVLSLDRGLSGIGQQERGEDAEERGLAGSVGTDETKQFALVHRQRYIGEGLDLAVRLRQVADGYSPTLAERGDAYGLTGAHFPIHLIHIS